MTKVIWILVFFLLCNGAYAASQVEIATNATGDQQLIPSGSSDWLGETFLYKGITGNIPAEVNLTITFASSTLTKCTVWLMNTTTQSSTSQMSSQSFANATLNDCSGASGTVLQFNLFSSATANGFSLINNRYYGIAVTSEGGTGSMYLQQCSQGSPGCYSDGSWWQGTDNPPTGTSAGLDLNLVVYSVNATTTIPVVSNLNCTSCNPPGGDTTPPYSTSDTTPTFTFNTSVSANCRIMDQNQNYTAMGSSRQCTTTEGTLGHICTLTPQDELKISSPTVYIACASPTNDSLSNITSALMDITGLSNSSANAIDDGILASSIGSGATTYKNQKVYLRNLANTQVLATVDRVAVYGSQRWVINYRDEGEASANLFNITPVVYSLEMFNLSTSQIKSTVELFINSTKT